MTDNSQQVPNVDYGGSSNPGASTASDLGTGFRGHGVLPGSNFGYFGPTFNVGYYGPWRGGFGENTPYSTNNWYRPRLGKHHHQPTRPFEHPAYGQGQRAIPLYDTLAVEGGPEFAAGPRGSGDDYFGPSYNWGRGQDKYAYNSFGSDRGYGPGNWFNPNTAPDYGGQRPSQNLRTPLDGYGQPAMSGYAYQGTQTIGQASGSFQGIGPRGYRRSDERIREDVSEALTDDDNLDAADVDVRVSDGVVTLVGTVPDRQQKRRAYHDAENASGVRDVKNELQLRRAGERVVGEGAEMPRGQPGSHPGVGMVG